MKQTVNTLKERKGNNKITMVTCYDYTSATIVDEAEIDTILVGDSLGNTMMGYENTLPVTVDDMIHYAKTVVRGAKNTFVLVDMPFMSYQISVEDAVKNAGRIIKETNANAVKLEGGEIYSNRIKAIVDAGIPVCAHLGLTPQSVNSLGGYKVQGKDIDGAKKLINDAITVEEAGAFMLVLECVPASLAELITKKLSIPTIGIGAGNACDGQVLVMQDLLGINTKTAKFVKKYANLHDIMLDAFKTYKDEVINQNYPAKEHTYQIKDEILEKLY